MDAIDAGVFDQQQAAGGDCEKKKLAPSGTNSLFYLIKLQLQLQLQIQIQIQIQI